MDQSFFNIRSRLRQKMLRDVTPDGAVGQQMGNETEDFHGQASGSATRMSVSRTNATLKFMGFWRIS